MTGATGMPMFPLGTVLFPHTPVALRIFEERYLKMLGALLDADPPEFGVVLIERGSELGGGDERFGTGTVARLIRVIPQRGQMTVVARGTRRIEVVEWLDDAPYPSAVVHDLAEFEWDDALQPLLAEAEHIVRRVVSRAAAVGRAQWDASVELADRPVERAWQIAAIAPLGPLDQLSLLRSATLGGLLRATIDLTLAADDLLAVDEPGTDS